MTKLSSLHMEAMMLHAQWHHAIYPFSYIGSFHKLLCMLEQWTELPDDLNPDHALAARLQPKIRGIRLFWDHLYSNANRQHHCIEEARQQYQTKPLPEGIIDLGERRERIQADAARMERDFTQFSDLLDNIEAFTRPIIEITALARLPDTVEKAHELEIAACIARDVYGLWEAAVIDLSKALSRQNLTK